MRITEKAVQRQLKAFLSAWDCEVWDLTQPRAAMVDPGVPDLLVWLPLLGAPAGGVWCWIEVKSPSGRIAPAQHSFRALAHAALTPHIFARCVYDVYMLFGQWRERGYSAVLEYCMREASGATGDARVREARQTLAQERLQAKLRSRQRRWRGMGEMR